MPMIKVLDSTIHYEERGKGMSYIFLHGNPTSSYVWRNIMPLIGESVHSLAPDLVGMGQSGKPDIDYSFTDHARYLEAWFDALGLRDVVLVGHDWGGALAMDWAARHPDRVRGLVLMETIIRPLSWDDMPGARPRYELLRSAAGEVKVLDENFFIEQALRLTIQKGISDADLDVYRQPYPTRDSRRPLLAWPRSMPIEGEPADVVERIETYDRWLGESADVPKLLLTFDGTAETLLVGPAIIDWCGENIANLEIRNCGPARHIVPEDQPEAIAAAIVEWAGRNGLGCGRADH
jgi:haloalkane dehalogenase